MKFNIRNKSKSKGKVKKEIKSLGNTAKIEEPEIVKAKLREPVIEDPNTFPTMDDIKEQNGREQI